jgi:hypothetical protein
VWDESRAGDDTPLTDAESEGSGDGGNSQLDRNEARELNAEFYRHLMSVLK